jgi:hypothetical protein
VTQSAATMPAPTPITDARPVRPMAARPASAAPADPGVPPTSIRPDRLRPERAAPPVAASSPPASAAVPPAEVPAASGTLTVEQIDGMWNRIKQAVRMEGQTKTHAILIDVSVYDVRGNLVVLRASSLFHQKHINEEETKLLLEKVIGQVMGQPVRVICEAVGIPASGAAPQNGRNRRPESAPSAGEPAPPVRALSPAAEMPPAPNGNGSNHAASADPPAMNEDDAYIRKLSNLYDAQILDADDAPPFPKR